MLTPNRMNGESVKLAYNASHTIINTDNKNAHDPMIIKIVPPAKW
jgi:hypothetical protein